MLKLIPKVKNITYNDGFLSKKAIFFNAEGIDKRVVCALEKFPYSKDGVELDFEIGIGTGDEYSLSICQDKIKITAQSAQGAFYAVQTLRQIFMHDKIPCVLIEDKPDFAYRGFYHDVTRGKVPTLETLKKLIDDMAFYKLNSLQLYVEHTFDFKELSKEIKAGGVLTSEELQELNEYCKQNFIDFIPSLSTFGHLYELLNQDKYAHLRCAEDVTKPYHWWGRMRHHTLDPLNQESIEIVKSLIDQYAPNFDSEYFNICCDETFDLSKGKYAELGMDTGKLYIDFVKKIISHVKSKNKKVMMWADILLRHHRDLINELPNDTYFLNWNYSADPSEEDVTVLSKLDCKQIVCPGTTTWNRFCEDVEIEEQNISRMAEYGYKYGAIGVLNTNWGDWGNIASIENAMYGLVLGAEKSWSPLTQINDEFYEAVNFILYKNDNAIQIFKQVSAIVSKVNWLRVARNYTKIKYNIENIYDNVIVDGTLESIQADCKQIEALLQNDKWENDEFRIEMLLAAQGACVCAEQYQKIMGANPLRTVDVQQWLTLYSQKWLEKNKPSELYRVQDVFTILER